MTYKTIQKNKIAFILFLALICVFSASAQTPTPTPEPVEQTWTIGDYEINSAIEIGVRGIDVNGSDNKFRSDFNYKPGIRLFDSSFSMEDKSKGVKLFDSLTVTSSGWGGDPTGMFRLNMGRAGIYSLDSNVRSVKYFNFLNNHALGEHNAKTEHAFGDFDLTIFPESDKLRFKLGYSFNQTDGTGGFTTRAYSDEFPVSSDVRIGSSDFRAGIGGKLFGFNLNLSQGYRNFRNTTAYTLLAPHPGNTTTNNARLATFLRSYPIEGDSFFTMFSAQRTFAERLDFTGRFIYSSTQTKFSLYEAVTGRDNSNNIVDLDRFEATGDAKRPQARGDVGLTLRITDDFRVSNTFTFDQFSVSGGNQFFNALYRRNNAGNPLATTFANTLAHRVTGYRRLMNTIEADYQFNNAVAFNIGYRFTKRRVRLEGFDQNLLSAANPTTFFDEFDNRTNTLIAGMKIKPVKSWTIFWDVEHGEADNVFTRLSNYKFTNFRVRSLFRFKDFTINLSAISRDNNNPGRTVEVPIRDFRADTKSRTYSAFIDWAPRADFSLSSGYTYQHQTSETAIIVPVGGVRTQGISQFFIRDNYFFFDVAAQPFKRFSLFASYRINKDKGQGDRFSAVPQNIITSYPFTLQSPEVRLIFRVTKNIDWNVGYQYYDYKERLGAGQNYSAHMPYTSLRIYFGRRDR